MKSDRRIKMLGLIAVGLAVTAALGWLWMQRPPEIPAGFVMGNGRIEATEITVASRLAGRVKTVLVEEGVFVKAGQVLATMEFESLMAQRDEAQARFQQARDAVATAQAQMALRQSEHAIALALVSQRESELAAVRRRFKRSEELFQKGFISGQLIDNDRSQVEVSSAIVSAARSQAAASEAAIAVARTQVTGAIANVAAAKASIARIEADLSESSLSAPRDGRVQYLITKPGEVIGAGGRVLSLIDLSDVYMTFFLPEAIAGRVAIGSEARLVLDAAPSAVIPAKISFVSSIAQFTPKTVETASEREKLMFRVRAQIDRELLVKHLDQVKTGLPGVAWVKLDAQAIWPKHLTANVR